MWQITAHDQYRKPFKVVDVKTGFPRMKMVIVLTSTNVGQRVHVIHVLSALTQREVITVNAMKAFMGMEKHVVAKRSIFCKRVI